MQKLPVWRTIGAAYGFVFGRPSVFLRAAWPWFVLLVTIFVASLFGNAPSSLALPLGRSQQVVNALALGFFVVGLGFFVSVSVAIHRAIILNEVSWRAPLRFFRRQWRFFGVGILIALTMILPLLLLKWILSFFLLAVVKGAHFMSPEFMRGLAVVSVFGWALPLVVWAIGSNMIIALPSVAIDEPRGSISRALQRSQGNRWRLYFGSLLCWAPSHTFQLVDGLLAFADTSRWPGAGYIRAHVSPGHADLIESISFVVDVFETALLVAYYSYAFRELTSATGIQGSSLQAEAPPAQ